MTLREARAEVADRSEALAWLREQLAPGDKVYCLVVHVAPSGMYRVVKTFIARSEAVWDISGRVARAANFRWDDRHGGIGVKGVGMDVRFETVYGLSYTLFGDGYALQVANL